MSYGENGGMSPADYAAITGGGNNNRGDGMFGDDLLALIILFAVFGGGFGWNGGRGGSGSGGGSGGGTVIGYPCATAGDVRAAVDQQTLISKLDNAVYGLSDVAYALNNTITSGFHNTTIGMMNGFNALQAALCELGSRIDKCCCETQRSIDSVNYNMSKNFCDLGNLIQNNTRDVIENNNANYRGIMDFMVQEKLDSKDAIIAELRTQVSQSNQNAVLGARIDAAVAEILRRTGAECPTAAYIVNAPTPVHFPTNQCGQVQFGCNGGYSGGCGCGCGNGF